jgi:hypothetical protein
VAALRQIANGEDGAWLDLLAAGIGWVPGVGDAIKAGIRGSQRAIDAGTEVAQGAARRVDDAGGVSGDVAAKGVANVLPENPSQLGHIFRDAPGHLPDTIVNRQLLLDTATNQSNSFGVNRFGNEVFISTRADGSQVWVETRNGIIQNGGVNNPPRIWIPGEGLR